MINIEEQYLGLMSGVLHGGKPKDDRTGTGTLSVFGRTIEHDMALGFPLLTTKRVFFNNAIVETLWILQGRSDLAYLEQGGVKYWRPDYERSGRTDGTLGRVYGVQWRDFNGIDQLKNLLSEIESNPTSRRLMVSAWNPADMHDMALPPCHYGFQVYINDGKLDLMWQQRSVDIFLGLPYDIAIYGLLLEMLALGSGYKPGRLIAQLGDCHLYKNHIDAATTQLQRTMKPMPKLELTNGLKLINGKVVIPEPKDVSLVNYKYDPPIQAPLSVGK